jgi:hypothetical protein
MPIPGEKLWGEELWGGAGPPGQILDAGATLIGVGRPQMGGGVDRTSGLRIQGAALAQFGGAPLNLPPGGSLLLTNWLRDGG